MTKYETYLYEWAKGHGRNFGDEIFILFKNINICYEMNLIDEFVRPHPRTPKLVC